MSNENKTVRPIEPLMQMTLAGNLVILDPVTRREQFFEANEAHNRFTNAKGQQMAVVFYVGDEEEPPSVCGMLLSSIRPGSSLRPETVSASIAASRW